MDDVFAFINIAALSVANDMERKPVTGADGIWRFDRAIEASFRLLFDAPVSSKPKEFWLEVERAARKFNAGKDTWDRGGFGIVASFAQTKAAYATPGFAEARRNWMT